MNVFPLRLSVKGWGDFDIETVVCAIVLVVRCPLASVEKLSSSLLPAVNWLIEDIMSLIDPRRKGLKPDGAQSSGLVAGSSSLPRSTFWVIPEAVYDLE